MCISLTSRTGGARFSIGVTVQTGVVLSADSKTDVFETLAIGSRELALGHHALQPLEIGLNIARLETRSGGSSDGRHDRGESHDGREGKADKKHVCEEIHERSNGIEAKPKGVARRRW